MHYYFCIAVVPLLLPTVKSVMATEGQTVNFDCIPTPNNMTIQWLHNGEVVLSSQRIKLSPPNLHHTVRISDVYNEDSGVYTCYVEESKKFVNRTVTVTVSEGKAHKHYKC